LKAVANGKKIFNSKVIAVNRQKSVDIPVSVVNKKACKFFI